MLSLVLSVLAKPISSVLVQIIDVKYEFLDDCEKNEFTEKESNIGQEELSSSKADFSLVALYLDHTRKYYTTQRNIVNFKSDIQLPPPKI